MFQHGHPSMSATECTNLHLKNSMEYSSLGNGTRFHNTCGTPGGHQKNRSDRENTRFSALQKWCPPLLRILNINNHESGGHRFFENIKHCIFSVGSHFLVSPRCPTDGLSCFKIPRQYREYEIFYYFPKISRIPMVKCTRIDVSSVFVTKQRMTNGSARVYSRTRCAIKHIFLRAVLAFVKGIKGFRGHRVREEYERYESHWQESRQEQQRARRHERHQEQRGQGHHRHRGTRGASGASGASRASGASKTSSASGASWASGA